MSAGRRWAAIAAIASTAALAVLVVVFLVRNIPAVLFGIAGLFVAVAGAWWVAAERDWRHRAGWVGVAGGVALLVVGVVLAVGGADRILARVAVFVALLAVVVLTTRVALGAQTVPVGDSDAAHAGGDPPVPPGHPVLLCNPWSGGGKVEQFGLLELAEELGVETVLLDHGLDLEQLARGAVADGADCLGMAGGDGSQALVASIAVEHGLPFVCISAGTRNHFALDLGLDRDDPRSTMYAFRDAVPRRVDYATVGDRLFVNNVSLGVYATVVQEDSYRDAKVETARSRLPELLGRQAEPFDLQFTTPDGEEIDGAFVVMVSNNPYALGAKIDVAQRRRLDSGVLGVFAVSAPTGAAAARLVTLSAVGQRQRSPYWHEFTTEEFEVRSRSGTIFAGVDGEALDLPSPLVFRTHPLGLTLLVPEGNREIAAARKARDRTLRDLVTVARGREPLS
ncbi:MAG: diacylglycerol kinase [Acidimicrobiia bacterium]|nr:diacylglycerol kinase [Acidimicrobiia bacterium]